MKQILLVLVLLLSICRMGYSQATNTGEVRHFELTAVAPPVPAMKYHLLFEDMLDRRPGNAAVSYLDAILLMGAGTGDQAKLALDALDHGDQKTFDSLVDKLDVSQMFQELDVAGRREDCDWQIPMREMGAATPLPHLRPLRDMGRVIESRARRLIDSDKIDDAIATLRLGYELGDKLGHEHTLISGLVSLVITGSMDNALTQLMNRPDSPNLYWALRDIPSRQTIIRGAFEAERFGWLAAAPTISFLLRSGKELTADQWRAALGEMADLAKLADNGTVHVPDPIRDASPEVIQQAQQAYAQSHHVSADQAKGVDLAIVLGEFYFNQYVATFDEFYKLVNLPYPSFLALGQQYDAVAKKIKQDEPANPFLPIAPDMSKAVGRFARVDRQIAALTAVEAIRSYAAANGGNLPDRLDQIADTPVPENPITGKPFDYYVDNGVATLADSQSQEPLTYTIKIRK